MNPSVIYKNEKAEFTFPSGILLTDSHIVFPAREDIGTFSFPIRFSGDVFHGLLFDRIKSASDIPKHCRAW